MGLEVKQLTEPKPEYVDTISNWLFGWWGKEEAYTMEQMKVFVSHCFQTDKLPMTFGLFKDNELIGMYQFEYDDLFVRPDIYPWCSNVYIDEKYRGRGYSKFLISSIKDNFPKFLGFDTIYLYTPHHNLFDKYDWKYIGEIDTLVENPRICRMYKLIV